MDSTLSEIYNLIRTLPDNILPTMVILISAVIYYFGVRWGETQVEEYNAGSHYYAGVLFITNFVLVPYIFMWIIVFTTELLIEHLIGEHTFHFSISDFEINSVWDFDPLLLILLLLFLEFIIYCLVRSNLLVFEGMRKSPDKFEECDCKKAKVQEWLSQKSIPCLIIIIIYGSYKLNTPVIILASFLFAFLTFTNLVFCAGYCEAHYPVANIYCKNGMIINGIILKHGNYVDILTENNKFLINRGDICHIEESENPKKLCIKYYPIEPILKFLKAKNFRGFLKRVK